MLGYFLPQTYMDISLARERTLRALLDGKPRSLRELEAQCCPLISPLHLRRALLQLQKGEHPRVRQIAEYPDPDPSREKPTDLRWELTIDGYMECMEAQRRSSRDARHDRHFISREGIRYFYRLTRNPRPANLGDYMIIEVQAEGTGRWHRAGSGLTAMSALIAAKAHIDRELSYTVDTDT